jgi:hypothetical protein
MELGKIVHGMWQNRDLFRNNSQLFIPPTYPPDYRQCQDDHPGFPDYLTAKEIQASECQLKKQNTIDNQTDDAAHEHSQNQSLFLEGRVNGKIS